MRTCPNCGHQDYHRHIKHITKKEPLIKDGQEVLSEPIYTHNGRHISFRCSHCGKKIPVTTYGEFLIWLEEE